MPPLRVLCVRAERVRESLDVTEVRQTAGVRFATGPLGVFTESR